VFTYGDSDSIKKKNKDTINECFKKVGGVIKKSVNESFALL
jgi:hypothetical protein